MVFRGALNYPPSPGAGLTVLHSTGREPIQSTFANLPQGQIVNLIHDGVTYAFVANYFGGSGNDLVLQWANTRVLGWGSNNYGQLGYNTTTTRGVAVPVDMTGVLADKVVITTASGGSHSLALCADGTIAAWGLNSNGQLGNNSTTTSKVPVLVDQTGVLAGKTVVAISAGNSHSLALCADGTLAAWGYNNYGQLGNNSTSNSVVPVEVIRTGVLLGKTVIGISAGSYHNLVRCSDGTLAAWGDNTYGQLGNNSTVSSSVPVVVSNAGVLPGKVVIAALAGGRHSLALCLDGTLAAWGYNVRGQLGNNSTTNSKVPVLVSQTGVLSDYTVVAISCGGSHNLALCSDGTLAVWGDNYFGQLGINSTTSSLVPVLVTTSGVLSGKAIVGLSAGLSHSFALCPDASLAAWGANDNGQLGNNSTTNSSVPVWVNTDALQAGERFVAVSGGTSHSLAMVALPPRPMVTTLEVNAILDTGATVHGRANANGSITAISFEYGLTTSYGSTATAAPASITGTTTTAAEATLSGLLSGSIYHYRMVATSAGGTVTGEDMVFTTTTFASLSGLALSNGTLYPSFASINTRYVAQVPFATSVITVTPVTAYSSATVMVAGVPVASGAACDPIHLSVGNNPISVVITAEDVTNTQTYTVMVTRLPEVYAFDSDSTVPVTVSHFVATGNTATFGLNYAPQPGASLTVVENTGPDAIQGAFDNLAQGQLVQLTFGDVSYSFVANYLGGDGNDLILQWANTGLLGWGANGSGQLGNNSTSDSGVAIPVDMSGVLAGKTIIATAAGNSHSLALCADGTLAAWGYNSNGQLGNNSTTLSLVPVPTDRTGALFGKTIAAISAGNGHNLALCSDGSLAAWGSNDYGQLGNNSTTPSKVPQLVGTSGLVSGTRFMAAAGGTSHSLALTALPLQAATSLPASVITGLSATLNGSVNGNGNATTVAFEYGLTASYGNTIAGAPLDVTGASDTSVSAAIGGLTPGTLYHYRVVTSSYGGIVRSADMTFTTLSDNAKLAALDLSAGTMVPGFGKLTTSYIATVPFAIDGVTVTPVTDHFGASVQVNEGVVASGMASRVMALPVGDTTLTAMVTAEDGIATMTYAITVTRLPLNFTFHSASDVPVSANGFAAGGIPVDIVLDCAPVPGTVLTMVNNTGLGFIHGNFGNLAQGQRIGLAFDGKTYDFVANYYGGSGNDLVLQWADTTLAGWGSNSYGQLGDNSTTRRLLPNAVDATGVLAGKTITAMAGGYLHSLALCSDGTLADWGYNVYGQLGNHSAAPSSVPVAVDRSGVLADKTVVAIAAGPFHNLALCSDGSVAAWGYNNYGQLGTGDTATRRVPVLVNPTGTFAGKHVVAVAAGAYHSFALCDDGTLAAWGYNDEGELGDGSTANSLIPVAVDRSGALAGKRIASLSAGQYHTLALCTDGTLLAWGYNNRGQLGNDSTDSSKTPVVIGSFGALVDKPVVAIRASGAHSMALCADGTLAAWGWNKYGQLGLTGVAQGNVPEAVDLSGVAAGRSLSQIALGGSHSLACFTDGTLAAWGDNVYGQLGNSSATPGAAPGMVDMSGLGVGARCMMVASGAAAQHNLAVVALPVASATPQAGTLQATALTDADHDGHPDLIEHAFDLHSDPNGFGHLPQPRRVGDNLEIRFTRPAGVSGIIYGAEWSPSLLPGSWIEVPDGGTGEEHRFSVPLDSGPRVFLRLKVSGR